MGLTVQIRMQRPPSGKQKIGSQPGALDALLRNSVGRGNSAREAVAIARAAALSGAKTSLPLDVENASRDFIREGKRSLQVNWGLWAEKTHVHRPHSTCSEEVDRHILLPHEFMSKLYDWDRGRFDELMGVGECADFWHNVSAHNPEWFTSHPAHDAIMKEPHLHIPVRVFADDGGLGKTRSLNVVHWASMVTRAHATGDCKIPMMVQADATEIKGLTYLPLHSVIAWSFNCALTGLHPRRGPWDEPFEDRQRRQLADQNLAGGFKLVYVMFVGDWKGEWETFHLPHYYGNYGASCEMCHLCWATVAGELSYCQPINNPCFDHPRSNDDYMASEAAALSPLTQIHGFHIRQVLPDAMHVGPLGIHLQVAGSVLWELCDEGCFGPKRQLPTWAEDLQLRLTQAYSEFWNFIRSKGKFCTQPMFTVSRLKMKSSKTPPRLKAKAANAMMVVDWLADYCDRQLKAKPDNERYAERASMLWGLTSVYKIWRESPLWLTPEARQMLVAPRDAFFGLYVKLCLQAKEDRKPLYKMVPKHHMLDHMVRHCLETGLNPCAYWCFQDEDAMRLQMGIANYSKQGTVDKFALNRWCLQYFAKPSPDPSGREGEVEPQKGWKRPHPAERACKRPRVHA